MFTPSMFVVMVTDAAAPPAFGRLGRYRRKVDSTPAEKSTPTPLSLAESQAYYRKRRESLPQRSASCLSADLTVVEPLFLQSA